MLNLLGFDLDLVILYILILLIGSLKRASSLNNKIIDHFNLFNLIIPIAAVQFDFSNFYIIS
jgi:hypothetical protein